MIATIPAAIIVGLYMRFWRPGRVLEGSVLGFALLALALVGGGWIDHQPALRGLFDYSGVALAALVAGYAFCAAILPVWLLLAPRDYLSTFLKIGTVLLARDRHHHHAPDAEDAGADRRSSTAPARCSAARCSRSCSSPSPAGRSPASTRSSPAARRRS